MYSLGVLIKKILKEECLHMRKCQTFDYIGNIMLPTNVGEIYNHRGYSTLLREI